MKKYGLILLLLCLNAFTMLAQDSLQRSPARDSVLMLQDTNLQVRVDKPRNLLDSLGQPQTLRLYFFLHENISGNAIRLQNIEDQRDLPRLKAIRLRNPKTDHWKFWILLGTILFLSLIRLINVKRFDEIMRSAFDLQTDYKSFSDKTGNYFVSNLGLFLNFILSLSLYLTNVLEVNHQIETDNYYLLFWKFSLGLLLAYVSKIVINLLIGSIFKMRGLSTLILINAIIVNNVLGVGLVFLNLFFVFVTGAEMVNLVSGIILVTILVAVIYRQIKNLIMTPQNRRFQFIYIFLYLCALEILPWLVVFKMFLNAW